jgi:hypothetical protein
MHDLTEVAAHVAGPKAQDPEALALKNTVANRVVR